MKMNIKSGDRGACPCQFAEAGPLSPVLSSLDPFLSSSLLLSPFFLLALLVLFYYYY